MRLAVLYRLLQREGLIVLRQRSDTLQPLWFFILVVLLFPLAITPEPTVLAHIAAGIIWVAVILANVMLSQTLFRHDFQSGQLEQMALSPIPLALAVLIRLVVQWAATVLPILLMVPFFALAFSLPATLTSLLILTLLLGTPSLTLLSAVVAALTLRADRGHAMAGLLLLPLYIPILIFGAGSIALAAQGIAISGQLALLAAIFVLALGLAPLACAAALRSQIT